MGRPRLLDYAKIKELYEQDMTENEIAIAIDANRDSVHAAIHYMNLPERHGHPQGKLDKIKDVIIDEYKSGLSAAKIAAIHGCASASIKELLKRNQVPMRTGAKRTDAIGRFGMQITAEWFAENLATYQTAAEIARHYNIPYGTLMSWAQKLRVDIPTWRGGPGITGSPIKQTIPVEEAISLSDQGWPYWKLAERYGVSEGVVVRRLLEAGYHSPKDKQRKHDPDLFPTAPWSHKKVLRQIGITECQLCGHSRRLDLCHIVPQRWGGPTVPENCFVMDSTCHGLFDHGGLTEEEKAKLEAKTMAAYKDFGQGRDITSNPNWGGAN